jgi:exopolyphosphatase/guanosine-5'-triphosphate,3'-diphosphate pyrophosphatase
MTGGLQDAQSRREAVLALARRYDFEEGHSLQDERLALRLYDETARLALHDMAQEAPATDASPRDVLSYAALLHDIGYRVGYEEHHKHAFSMIMAEPVPGFTPRTQALVAHVARYHRGGTPDPGRHGAFAALTAEDQQTVARLGALLRFADGLDRSHTDAVEDLRCELDGGSLIVTLLPGQGDEAERWAGQKKARWFEALYGVQVILR